MSANKSFFGKTMTNVSDYDNISSKFWQDNEKKCRKRCPEFRAHQKINKQKLNKVIQ